MGIIFSKIEKFFDKKYKYSNYNYKYDYEYDSIVKNKNDDYDDEIEDDPLIYDPKAKIDYYNKKLEGIMYL